MRQSSRRPSARVLLIAALVVGACASPTPLPGGLPSSGDRAVPIEAGRVSLGPVGARLAPGVTFAGGLSLRGSDLRGLSDIKLDGDWIVAVSDLGHWLTFGLVLDAEAQLMGVRDAISRPLIDTDGRALSPKARADAEGLAVLGDGRMLVAFEREHRVWSYGPGGRDRPTPVPHPDVGFPDNLGMEGLAASGPDGWLVMGEDGGAWTCRGTGCASLPGYTQSAEDGFRVTGADRDPAGGWFVVERFYAPPFDVRARVRRMAVDGTMGSNLIELRLPATVDNFEGIAAVTTSEGTRLYLLSDDNANPLQKTLLLAFDVRPAPTP